MRGEDLTQDERIERAQTAARLLEDPVLAEAFQAAEEKVVKAWLSSERCDPERATAAWAVAKATALVKEDLRRIVNDGIIAAEARKRRA